MRVGMNSMYGKVREAGFDPTCGKVFVFIGKGRRFMKLPCGQQAIEEQCVQLACRVEVVGLASAGCVGDVILAQFLYGSENRVGTTCAKCRVR